MYDLFCSAEPVPELAFLGEQPGKPRSLEQSGTKMSRHQSRKALQLRGNRKNQEAQKVVAGSETSRQLLERVAEIYEWLQKQVCSAGEMAGTCKSCGDCCDFEGFDHRLFITPPELMYLTAKLGAENIKPMPGGRCSYNVDNKCTIYEYRFSSCRIFCCNADTDFQSRLSEDVLKKLKSICVEFQIPYSYADLATVLNSLVGV